MKKLAMIITAVLFIGSLTTNAQSKGKNQKNDQQQSIMMQKRGNMQEMRQEERRQEGMRPEGMREEGMCPMCGMMMNQKMPMKKFMIMLNKLPNMQQYLSLSDDQVDKMIDLQAEYKKQQVDYQAELTKKHMNMEKVLYRMPSADEVKMQMQQCADIKINMKVAAYETVKKMKSLLTEEQKETLKSMMMNQDGMTRGRMMNQQQDQDRDQEEHH